MAHKDPTVWPSHCAAAGGCLEPPQQPTVNCLPRVGLGHLLCAHLHWNRTVSQRVVEAVRGTVEGRLLGTVEAVRQQKRQGQGGQRWRSAAEVLGTATAKGGLPAAAWEKHGAHMHGWCMRSCCVRDTQCLTHLVPSCPGCSGFASKVTVNPRFTSNVFIQVRGGHTREVVVAGMLTQEV